LVAHARLAIDAPLLFDKQVVFVSAHGCLDSTSMTVTIGKRRGEYKPRLVRGYALDSEIEAAGMRPSAKRGILKPILRIKF
jgi:hypothetical protein